MGSIRQPLPHVILSEAKDLGGGRASVSHGPLKPNRSFLQILRFAQDDKERDVPRPG